MRDDLSVMEMIVYDCNYGDSLSFKALQNMDDLERLKVIMSKVCSDDVIIMPFTNIYTTLNIMNNYCQRPFVFGMAKDYHSF